MHDHIPDKLPPLVADFGEDAYGYEAVFVKERKPVSNEEAELVRKMCELAIHQGGRVENAYPIYVGGVEQHMALRSLARQYGTELQFPLAKEL